MTYVLRHKYPKGVTHSEPSHEFRKRDTHGYSMQSAIQQSDGGPGPLPGSSAYPITNFVSQDDGDYSLSATGRPATKEAETQPAPIAEKISTSPSMQGRGFREEAPLMSHTGMQASATSRGLSEPNYKGFKYRGKNNRV